MNAHAAQLARTMGIPAVVMAGEDFLETCDGRLAALDGKMCIRDRARAAAILCVAALVCCNADTGSRGKHNAAVPASG